MHIANIDRRILLVIAGFGLLLTILTLRLFYLQIVQHQHLSQLALRQQERTIEVQPARGRIFDRQGRPLALNRQSASFYAVPREIRAPDVTARKLAAHLGVPARRLARRFRSRKAFVWVKRKAPDKAAQAVRALKLPGVHELKETTRVYPEGKLACHLLGFVGLDNQGLSGVELQFDRAIRGQSGWIRITRDAQGRKVPASTRVHKRSQPGLDVYLTIDKMIQHIAEKELARGLANSGAQAGSVIVMNPRTGELLALANLPDFDPNHFNRYRTADRRNRAITDIYEPGSTFKIVTAAAALEEGVFREEDIIDCEQGRGDFDGLIVRDHHPRGLLSVKDVIVYSSNVGAVKMGIRLGAEKLSRYAEAFGFGRPTGIELPGEVGGILKPFRQWRRWTATSVPFGQGVAVTTLQMTAAYAAIANQGQLIKPWVVKELRRPDDIRTKLGKPVYRERVISSQTAARMCEILEAAVSQGTGQGAAVEHYQVAGKTGTAQKPLASKRGYDPEFHVASFIGFIPAERAEFLIAVMIDGPRGVQWGGVVAGPVFKKITHQLVAYLGLPPGPQKVFAFAKEKRNNRYDPQQILSKVPEVTGLTYAQAREKLRAAGLQAQRLGQGGQVLGQRPRGGQRTSPGSPVALYVSDPDRVGAADQTYSHVVVPDLGGQSLRDALQIIQAYGLRAEITGSGLVNWQDPRPRTRVKVGELCAVHGQDPERTP